MNRSDKNIALAKECGADIDFFGGRMAHRSNHRITFAPRELDEYTSRVCAEKDTIIAMQAEALRYAIDDLVIRAKLHEDDSLSIGQGCLDQMNAALSATAATAEAWKKSHITGLKKAAWYDGYTEREQELRNKQGDKK